jgi:hypothetical protein
VERLKGLPPAIPREYYARLPETPSAPQAPRPWFRAIPGFRSGRRWRYPLAVLGYGVLMVWIAQIPFHRVVGLLGVGALAVLLLATDAFGVARRSRTLGSGYAVVAGTGWAILTVLVLVAAVLAGGPLLPSSSAASELPLPNVSSTAGTPTPVATSTSTPTPPSSGTIVLHTPTPSPSDEPARTPAPRPSATEAPTPPPTPVPTPKPTPTPTPTPAPTPTSTGH